MIGGMIDLKAQRKGIESIQSMQKTLRSLALDIRKKLAGMCTTSTSQFLHTMERSQKAVTVIVYPTNISILAWQKMIALTLNMTLISIFIK